MKRRRMLVNALVVLALTAALAGCGAGIGPSYWGLMSLQVGLAGADR